MKCPKCQQENTLKNAENNAIVSAACGSRFSLPASTTSQTPPPPVDSPTAQFFHKGEQILRDGLASLPNAAQANAGVVAVATLGSAILIWLLWASSARRLRDAGLSPWLTVLHLVISVPLVVFLAIYNNSNDIKQRTP